MDAGKVSLTKQRKQLEKRIERSCVEMAKAKGFWGIKLESPTTGGLPDRMFLGPDSEIFFVEFKRPGGRTRPLQDVIIGRIRKLGFPVFIVRSKEDMRKVLNEVIYTY